MGVGTLADLCDNEVARWAAKKMAEDQEAMENLVQVMNEDPGPWSWLLVYRDTWDKTTVNRET